MRLSAPLRKIVEGYEPVIRAARASMALLDDEDPEDNEQWDNDLDDADEVDEDEEEADDEATDSRIEATNAVYKILEWIRS